MFESVESRKYGAVLVGGFLVMIGAFSAVYIRPAQEKMAMSSLRFICGEDGLSIEKVFADIDALAPSTLTYEFTNGASIGHSYRDSICIRVIQDDSEKIVTNYYDPKSGRPVGKIENDTASWFTSKDSVLVKKAIRLQYPDNYLVKPDSLEKE